MSAYFTQMALKTLNLPGSSNLGRLVLSNGAAPQLEQLDLSCCGNLQYVFVQSATLQVLRLTGCTALAKVRRLSIRCDQPWSAPTSAIVDDVPTIVHSFAGHRVVPQSEQHRAQRLCGAVVAAAGCWRAPAAARPVRLQGAAACHGIRACYATTIRSACCQSRLKCSVAVMEVSRGTVRTRWAAARGQVSGCRRCSTGSWYARRCHWMHCCQQCSGTLCQLLAPSRLLRRLCGCAFWCSPSHSAQLHFVNFPTGEHAPS
jgi:hypothetical protein